MNKTIHLFWIVLAVFAVSAEGGELTGVELQLPYGETAEDAHTAFLKSGRMLKQPQMILPQGPDLSSLVFSWIPVGVTGKYRATLSQWTRRAGQGPFVCKPKGGHQSTASCIILNARNGLGEAQLVSCYMSMIGRIYGAPEDCVSIAIFAPPGTTWVKVLSGPRHYGLATGGRPDIIIKIYGGGRLSFEDIFNAAKRALKTPPLDQLVLQSDRGGSLIGISQWLPSKVLPGWREWLIVRVRIEQKTDNRGPLTTAIVEQDLSLNRQNTLDGYEMRHAGPQHSAYTRVIRNNFKRSLESLCNINTRSWEFDDTLVCQW